jgi:hypothetical protein
LPRCAAKQWSNERRRKLHELYTALVPNVRGAEHAIEARADEFNLVMSASEAMTSRTCA